MAIPMPQRATSAQSSTPIKVDDNAIRIMGSRDVLQAVVAGTQFTVRLPGLERGVAKDLVHEAEGICPYSKATRGNIEVAINLV